MSESFGHLALGAGVTAAFHPIAYAKVLIQLGYEPAPTQLSKTLFGNEVYYYPNVFRYLGYIKRQDGFFGLYRGLFPRLLSGMITSFVTTIVQKKLTAIDTGKGKKKGEDHEKDALDEIDGVEENQYELVKRLGLDTLYEVTARCSGVVLSQPFTVIMVRSMAQYVGRETKYNTVLGSIQTIWEEEGFLGLFKGLIPRLIGEALTICIANMLGYLVNYLLISTQKDNKMELKSYSNALCSMMATQVTYSYNIVSTLMTTNGSGLRVCYLPMSRPYINWNDCWAHLKRTHNLKRGSSLFWRTDPIPVIRKY